MTATSQGAADAAVAPATTQAVSLWTFLQPRALNFTVNDASEVVESLGNISALDAKALAKKLRTALAARRVSLKHTNALQAAARLLGHTSYHEPGTALRAPPLLQLVSFASSLNRPLRDWEDGIQCFCDYAEGDQEGGGFHLYQIGFTLSSVTMGSPYTTARDQQGRSVPELQVQWSTEGESQLPAAIAAVETLRRRFEETGRAVVDGLAAAYFCLRNPHEPSHPHDPANSELVVIDVTPGLSFGHEVARGDEVKCWSELEMLHPKDSAPTYALDSATWTVDRSRYEWRLSTVRTEGVVPSIVTRLLTEVESAKLFRRHRKAVSSGRYLAQEDRVKSLPSEASAALHVDLDFEQVLKYSFKGFAEQLALERSVPVSTLLTLAQALKLSDPSVLVRKPKRAELTRLDDDQLLRTFVSRVHEVSREVPRRLSEEVLEEVDKAIDQLMTALKNDVVMADGTVHDAFPRGAPYMTYANQGKDMLARLRQLGLVVYAGIFTTVKPFRARNGWEQNVKSSSSLKVERVLLLDIDFADDAVER